MNIPEHIFKTLTDEQKKKVEAAQTPEELLSIAREYGKELTDEQLDAMAGGDDICWQKCVIVCTENCVFKEM